MLRRNDPYGKVRWFGIDPCYVFHPLNAYDAPDGTIVLHVMRYPELWRRTGDVIDRRQEAVLWKWTIDPATGTVHEEQCDDRPGEFPRVDDRLTGLDAAYGHMTCSSSLVRYELGSGAATAHDFGPRRTPGEAAFAPAGDTAGGPGWLMTYVYDAGTDRSDLVILDASDLAADPVATIHLPARVPYGFHGNWLAD